MYKTYVKLFRVQPEITTLGTGKKVIRLPKELWLTVDTVIITFFALPIVRYLIVPILDLFININELGSLGSFVNWFLAFVISFLLSMLMRKFDPDGKSVNRWIWDYVKFTLRPKFTDGWSKVGIYKTAESSYKINVDVFLVKNNICGSLPAVGEKVDKFALYSTANVTIRYGKVKFTNGNSLKPGIYAVRDNKIIRTANLPQKAKKVGAA
ncbi:TcpE family conjugal transfer membrane protein [Paenibacillus macquariensis]|uniref:TcpE family protein n=1 Tax=Paenibacillus macquariensis TaxID=948756 RepID=A0ABY1KEI4_9BACL|nr:TcpE family conjugal transfer membrane protein [Paenibacillus macquariensis]OAB28405.1 hypothetical protein PMSM_24425 [Paenibacillus macquariensis subsp. macquariensis]SIR71564.1 TcpE family protein [Paenibacillus macquariensis]